MRERKPKPKRPRVPDPHRPQLRSYDLQARWDVSRQSIYVWQKKGWLPKPKKIGPNTYAWPIAVIEEFERSRASA